MAKLDILVSGICTTTFYFYFWPQLKCNVAAYIRTCHSCQLTAKLNQTIEPALLVPIPVAGKSFDHLISDCVGPFCHSKAGSICKL